MNANMIIEKVKGQQQNTTITIGTNSTGEILIADEVVAMIASLAASETEGVASVGDTYASELMSKVGINNKTKGVKANIKDNTVRISIVISIKNGFSIPTVSQQVQNKVKASIENMTGMTVKVVNVRVIDVEI